jgi:hypothetical protein
MDSLNPTKLMLVSVIAFVFGCYMLYTWPPIAADRNFPIVTGKVTDRRQLGQREAEFTIQISAPPAIVHAHTQKYLLNRVPDEVRFHYTGDSECEVYLIDHEENPLWIALTCMAGAIFPGALAYRGFRIGAR